MTWITGGHHVLGIEHLLCQLWHRESSVLLTATTSKWCESWHEEMQSWERHHIDGEFAEIGIQLTRKTQTGGDSGHRGGHQMIEIPISWIGELQGTETDVVESLVVNTEGLISIFYQLMHGESGIVRLHNSIRNLREEFKMFQ